MERRRLGGTVEEEGEDGAVLGGGQAEKREVGKEKDGMGVVDVRGFPVYSGNIRSSIN